MVDCADHARFSEAKAELDVSVFFIERKGGRMSTDVCVL